MNCLLKNSRTRLKINSLKRYTKTTLIPEIIAKTQDMIFRRTSIERKRFSNQYFKRSFKI